MKNKITKDDIYKTIAKILKTTPDKILKVDIKVLEKTSVKNRINEIHKIINN